MSFVSELEPHALWTHFDRILEIPRASKNEERMRQYVIDLARERGLEYRVDDVGNLVVRKPGTRGHENGPTTVLQCHLDMVEEKNADVDHDFTNDPIRPERDGAYLTAKGTTLGSDNGVGVAAMLAVLCSEELAHGPLEFLFTIDEETGLTGAAGLGTDLLQGRRLINLDSEEEGVLTIGCAGGADTHLELALSKERAPSGARFLSVRLAGLKGGHSGIDIHLQRGNATKLLARALGAAFLDRPFRLVALRGGKAHNAIPREAEAVACVGEQDVAAFRESVQAELEAIRREHDAVEPGMRFDIQTASATAEVLDGTTTARVLDLVQALPHGVVSMSQDIPGLVETSTNVAVIDETEGRLRIWISSRSSVGSALEALRRRIACIGALAGTEVRQDDGYPGWKPDVDSELLEVVKRVHREVTGRDPQVGAVHAGLECGIIGEKYPGMDMISFGPQIEFPHSPDERVKIDSVDTFYRLLTRTLERLAS